MLTPSDKELDRLSREAAEQYEPDESISSWERLEARLDVDMGKPPIPSTRRFGRGPIGYSAVILLITAASYFLFKQDNKIHSISASSKSNNESITKKVAGTNTRQSDDKSQQSDKSTGNAEKNAPAKPDPIASQKTDDTKSGNVGSGNPDAISLKPSAGNAGKNDNKTASQDKNAIAVNSTKKGTKEQPNSNAASSTLTPESVIPGVAAAGITIGNGHTKKTSPGGQNAGKTTSSQDITASGAAGVATIADAKTTGTSLNQVTVPSEKEPNLSILPGIEAISNAPLVSSSLQLGSLSAANLNSALSGPLSNKSAGKSRSLHLNRPLTIGLMIAPDVTTVHGTAPDRMSGNIGVTLGYQLTNRLSINSGFISTKKFYSAKGSDFHAPTTTPYLDFVQGDCNMYEIPLTLRYDFDAGDRTYFFVNGGLSSYLMTHESYVYYGHYSGPAGSWNYATQPTPFDSQSHYLFSVISLSIGIEHRIGKNFSLQGEPFVKIPLTGMGIGNLNLSSYGVSFSLRYSPVLGKSRH